MDKLALLLWGAVIFILFGSLFLIVSSCMTGDCMAFGFNPIP